MERKERDSKRKGKKLTMRVTFYPKKIIHKQAFCFLEFVQT